MTHRTRGGALLAGLAVVLASLFVAPAPAQAGGYVVGDGGFEDATGNPLLSPSWVESDSVFGSPICNLPNCGDGEGTVGPKSGSNFVWFGGAADTKHTQSMKQTFTLSEGVASLSFYVRIAQVTKPSTSVLKVEFDGKVIKKFAEPLKTTKWKLYEFDMTKYADGGTHTLKFSYTNGGKSNSLDNFLLDDVEFTVDGHSDADFDGVYDYFDKCDTVSGPGPTGCPSLGHDVSLSYSGGKFKGTVTELECGDSAAVKVMKVRSGPDLVVGTTTSNAAGEFALTRSAPAGKYYAVSPKRIIPVSGLCPGATSPLLQR